MCCETWTPKLCIRTTACATCTRKTSNFCTCRNACATCTLPVHATDQYHAFALFASDHLAATCPMVMTRNLFSVICSFLIDCRMQDAMNQASSRYQTMQQLLEYSSLTRSDDLLSKLEETYQKYKSLRRWDAEGTFLLEEVLQLREGIENTDRSEALLSAQH